MTSVDYLKAIREALARITTAEHTTVYRIQQAREHGHTWREIAEQFGHGRPEAARRWYQRRLKDTEQ